MSNFTKKPYIEKVLAELSGTNKGKLLNLVNGKNAAGTGDISYSLCKTASAMAALSAGVHAVAYKYASDIAWFGYFIRTTNYKYFITFKTSIDLAEAEIYEVSDSGIVFLEKITSDNLRALLREDSYIDSTELDAATATNIEIGSGVNSMQQHVSSKYGDNLEFENPNYTPTYTPSAGAEGQDSFEGNGNSLAKGLLSTAFGRGNIAEGARSFVAGGTKNVAIGINSHVEGQQNCASGNSSHAEGYQTLSSGIDSHAEGDSSVASGYASHAEGEHNTASGETSHSEGGYTIASGRESHSEGSHTKAEGSASHAEGANSIVSTQMSTGGGGGGDTPPTPPVIVLDENNGACAHAEGNSTIALGYSSHAEGTGTKAYGHYSHSEGFGTKAGDYDLTTGKANSGSYSHAEGVRTTVTGTASHVEGNNNTVTGNFAHAEGQDSSAKGIASHAEGISCIAEGNYSHAEGLANNAKGNFSHVEGAYNTATGESAHVDGLENTASGYYTNISGRGNKAGYIYQSVLGTYNENKSDTIFEVGIGTDASHRANGFEVLKSGGIRIGSTVLTEAQLIQLLASLN